MKYSDIPILVNYECRIETKVNVDGKTYYRPLIERPAYKQRLKCLFSTDWVKIPNQIGSLWVDGPYKWIRYADYPQEVWYETEAECIKMIKSFQMHNYTIEPFKQYLPLEY